MLQEIFSELPSQTEGRDRENHQRMSILSVDQSVKAVTGVGGCVLGSWSVREGSRQLFACL